MRTSNHVTKQSFAVMSINRVSDMWPTHRRRVGDIDVDVAGLEGEPGQTGTVETERTRWRKRKRCKDVMGTDILFAENS